LPESKIENVIIQNCTFHDAAEPSVFQDVATVELRNFQLMPREGLDND
jgi:hypothetical protein